ncbi:hypothetical protein IJ00_07460 [Calothrix sp. 336/3]|nr:hypothetical protein IJ00_07460 [Calothrix sp. 336/3]
MSGILHRLLLNHLAKIGFLLRIDDEGIRVIPIQKMFTTDTPPALSGTLPEIGRAGEGFCPYVVLFFQIGIRKA